MKSAYKKLTVFSYLKDIKNTFQNHNISRLLGSALPRWIQSSIFQMRKPDAPSPSPPPVTAALLLEQPNIVGDSYSNGGVRDVASAAGIRFEYGSGSRYRDTRQKKSPSCQLGSDCKYEMVLGQK